MHVALVCHPHPVFGGTMHNKVAYRAAKSALLAGLPTLRFNFRGAGASEGEHTGGPGERDDVRAALDYLGTHFPGLPVCLMGFSFGAWVGLEVGSKRCTRLHPRGTGRACQYVGPRLPARRGKAQIDYSGDSRPIRLGGEGDGVLCIALRAQANPLGRRRRPFFSGKLDEVQEVLGKFLAPTQRGNSDRLR